MAISSPCVKALEMPKSPSLTMPLAQQKQFPHFRSLCMMPCAAQPSQGEASARCSNEHQQFSSLVFVIPPQSLFGMRQGSQGPHGGSHGVQNIDSRVCHIGAYDCNSFCEVCVLSKNITCMHHDARDCKDVAAKTLCGRNKGVCCCQEPVLKGEFRRHGGHKSGRYEPQLQDV